MLYFYVVFMMKMKKKLLTFVCVLLFISLCIPVQASIEEKSMDNPFFNNMKFAHVNIQGSGREYMLGNIFIFGFGKASIMRINLYDDAQIEISELDGFDKVALEGSYTITLWGYYGFYKHTNAGITINGVAMVAFWK